MGFGNMMAFVYSCTLQPWIIWGCGVVPNIYVPFCPACCPSHERRETECLYKAWDTHAGRRGGGDAVRIFRIFSHFWGQSLSVMFKRKHFSRTLHLN